MEREQIERVVRAVINDSLSAYEKPHVCKCKRKMTLALANALIEAVCKKANEMGLSVVVAVSDEGGNPVSVQSMDNAYLASYDIALNKAYTVVALKMSTQQLNALAVPGGSLYGIQFTNNGKIVIFGGGEPLMGEGTKIVGGVGISGGSAEQDTALAAYAKQYWEDYIWRSTKA